VTGPVTFTQSERFKTRRFENAYCLYVVMNAGTGPKLYIVKNPAENLAPEERVEVVRYVVQSEQIKAKGEKTA